MMVAKGSEMSAESREKMAAAKRGRKQPPEMVEKRAAALRGKSLTLEHRKAISKAYGGGSLREKNGYLYRTGLIDHPLAEAGRVAEHRRVLYDAIGPGPHLCEVQFKCDGTEPLEWGGRFGVNVDHVDHNTMNNARGNLRVSCWSCNWNRDNPFHQEMT